MRDPEFIELRNRFLLGITICMVLLVPFFFFFYSKLIQIDSKIIQKIENKETFMILITNYNCKDCPKYEKTIKELSTNYQVMNKDKDKDYSILLKQLDIPEKDIISPALIYIENGTLKSTLIEIQTEEEVTTFVENFR